MLNMFFLFILIIFTQLKFTRKNGINYDFKQARCTGALISTVTCIFIKAHDHKSIANKELS